MRVIYKDAKVEEICNDLKKATKFFGGQKALAVSLLSRINALNQAENIKDIIVQKQMHFHKLINKGKGKNFDGFFAIDVKTIREKWRIILEPLDEKEQLFVPCNIDEIAMNVRIIEIKEVSEHYE